MALPIITLTTDFGLEDGYAGIVKGVIYSLNPAALPLDLTHAVSPQNVAQGAFLLFQAYRQFPSSTIHLAVVDPGVGTARRAVCLVVPEVGCFVGPDNGLFAYIVQAEGTRMRAYELSNPAYHRLDLSSTFHGRDIFGPVAAFLSLGEPPENFGPSIPISELVTLESLSPEIKDKGKLRQIKGQVAHIDHFGNVISNISAALLGDLNPTQRAGLRVSAGYLSAKGMVETYAQGKKGKLVILIGSSGFVEVARVEGRADLFGGNTESGPSTKVGAKLNLSFPL